LNASFIKTEIKIQGFMKEVFIISTGEIIGGNIAGSQRVLKIAKSLAEGNNNVYLCSLPQINNEVIETVEISPRISYLRSVDKTVNGKGNLVRFLHSVNRFIKSRNSETVIYLYPTTFVFKDFIYLFYFKGIKGHRFFCDINELRATNSFSATRPKGLLRKGLFFMKGISYFVIFKLSELQVYAYDGVVVISTNLERYFSRFTKDIIRVPILCDVTAVGEVMIKTTYDGTKFRICFAGMINSKKEGFDILFEALSLINKKKNVELFLYGPFSEEDRDVLDLLKKKHMLNEKVFYMGNLGPADLLNEFLKYHLLILPRPLNPQTKYGFSTKLSEYLISGVPVLVTDVSDNALYLKDGVNGYIIPPGSITAMESKLKDIIETYNMNASAIAENAFKTATREFDYRLYTKRLIDFFYNYKDIRATS
jgi:glycosyltransferase involved in cell wall biosynthesis